MKFYTLLNPTELEKKIMRLFGQRKELCYWKIFPDGEMFLNLKAPDKKAIVLGRTSPPCENFFQTLLLADTLRRAGTSARGGSASGGKINLTLPYFGYSRQDRKIFPGDALTSACLRDSLARAGVARIITLDLHSPRILEKSPVPIVNISMAGEFAAHLKPLLRGQSFTVAAPDYGSKRQAERLAGFLGTKAVAWMNKKRDPKTGKVAATYIEGKSAGRTAVIVDDILSTGKTIKLVFEMLKQEGFKTFYLCITHPVFAPGAARLIRRLRFKRILISDTLSAPQDVLKIPGLKIISAAKLLAKAIKS